MGAAVLAMPVSWKGTLQQYAGRFHREHAARIDVRIVDFVDTGDPALRRMWDRRQRGYRAMGYSIREDSDEAKSCAIDRLRYMPIDAESCFGISNEIDGESDGKTGGDRKNF